MSQKNGLVQVAHFDGDRNLAMFGSFIKFADLNGDDLLIGAPLHFADWTELIPRFLNIDEVGRLYIFYGVPRFPLVKPPTPRNVWIFPLVHGKQREI